jgi:broad specificity phosphatase PhoE
MFLLRHGQSEFNLHFTRTRRDPGIEDPQLTPEGRRQAQEAGQALAGAGITRILVSPYTRALQTAAEVADVLSVPILIDPVLRERFAFACDIGTACSRLAQTWPAHDFSGIDEVWWPGVYEPEIEVMVRADRFRAAMRRDPEAASTLLVSHWGFVLALTGRSIGNGEWLEWDPAENAPRELVWRH